MHRELYAFVNAEGAMRYTAESFDGLTTPALLLPTATLKPPVTASAAIRSHAGMPDLRRQTGRRPEYRSLAGVPVVGWSTSAKIRHEDDSGLPRAASDEHRMVIEAGWPRRAERDR